MARFDVSQAVEFFGERQERLGEDTPLVGEDGDFAGFGLEDAARDADVVADVEEVDEVVLALGELILLEVYLDTAGPVADVEKRGLAVAAERHNAAGDAREGAFGGGVVEGAGLRYRDGAVVARAVGVDAHLAEFGDLRQTIFVELLRHKSPVPDTRRRWRRDAAIHFTARLLREVL